MLGVGEVVTTVFPGLVICLGGLLSTQLLPPGLRFPQSGANANGPGNAAPAGELEGSLLGALGKY